MGSVLPGMLVSRVSVCVLVALLLVQLHAGGLQNAAKGVPSFWVLVTHMGDLEETSCCWLQAGLALAL